MADVVFSNASLASAVGTYPIGMLRAELLSRTEEGLLVGWRIYKVVHLKEKTLIGHEFCAVYLRKGNNFLVVRIERRPSMRKVASSSNMWSDDSISHLNLNFDSRAYYHLSTTYCDEAKPLTVLELCNICAYIRHAAPIYSVSKHKHCYWFCTAFLIRLSEMAYSSPPLQPGEDYERRGRFGWKRLITEASVLQELTPGAARSQEAVFRPSRLIPYTCFIRPSHFNDKQWLLDFDLKGHTEAVYSVCFASEGQHILSGSDDYTIRTWDVVSGKDARRPLKLKGLSGVHSIAVSVDGYRFALVSGVSGTVHIWDLEAGTVALELSIRDISFVQSTAFSPDGHTIALGAGDGSLHIWDAETGVLTCPPLVGHTDLVYAVAWSPDGRHVISGSRDGAIRMWDVQTAAPIGEPLLGPAESVTSVSFSPDGSRIVSASGDGTVQLWDTASRLALGEPLRGHTGSINSVIFSPGGRWIASGSGDKTVRVWDATSGSAGGEIVRLNTVSEVSSVAWSPTTECIAAGCYDGTVRVWRKAATRQNRFHETFRTSISPIMSFCTAPVQWISMRKLDCYEPIFGLCFTPDGRHLLSSTAHNTILKWDITAGKQAPPLEPLNGHTDVMRSLVVSSDGHRIVSASHDRTVGIWDMETGEPVMSRLRGHTAWVLSAVLSPDGSKIVSGSEDMSLRIWNAKTGAALGGPLLGHEDWVSSVAWSPDESHIVSGSHDRTIRVWDAQTGAPVGESLLGHTREVKSVCFSPDGRHLVSGSEDGTVRLWDTVSRRTVGEPLRGHTHRVRSVAFSPDGRWIASGSDDKTMRLWSSNSKGADGKVVTLDAHAEVWSVAWSPGGDVVAAACNDGAIRLWQGMAA